MATNGIATASDINKKCINSFSRYTDLNKCPTCEEIKDAIKNVSIPSSYSYNQLVSNSDINVSNIRIPITVSVYNDKSSKTPSDLTISGEWDVSRTDDMSFQFNDTVVVGEIAKNSWSSEYILILNLHSSLGGQQYFKLRCGDTDIKQKWWWRYGGSSTWTACKSSQEKHGYTAIMEIQPSSPSSSSSRSLLGSYDYAGQLITKIEFRITSK